MTQMKLGPWEVAARVIAWQEDLRHRMEHGMTKLPSEEAATPEEKAQAVAWWQARPNTECLPMLCPNNHPLPLAYDPIRDLLFCPGCDYRQAYVPKIVIRTWRAQQSSC